MQNDRENKCNSYNKSQRDAQFLKMYLIKHYMFRTDPLSIIRSISTLYTCNRYLSCWNFKDG